MSATALVVPEGSDIATVDDLGGVIVGAQDGTVQEEIANDTDAGEVRAFPEGTTALTALLTDQVEAVLVDEAVGADFLEKQGGVESSSSSRSPATTSSGSRSRPTTTPCARR